MFILKQLWQKKIFIILLGNAGLLYYICSWNPGTVGGSWADKSVRDVLQVPGTQMIFVSWVNVINDYNTDKTKLKLPTQTSLPY
jgi:hypothetical protein